MGKNPLENLSEAGSMYLKWKVVQEIFWTIISIITFIIFIKFCLNLFQELNAFTEMWIR